MRHLVLLLPWLATAWRPGPLPERHAPVERRAALRLVGALGLSVAISPAVAADTPSTAELQKLTIGYSRIQYLLDNWDDLTTTCKGIASETERKQAIATNAAACSKTPLVVQVRARSPFSCHIDASSRSRIAVVALIAAISPVRTLSATNP